MVLRLRWHCAAAIVLGAMGDRSARFDHLEQMRIASLELDDVWQVTDEFVLKPVLAVALVYRLQALLIRAGAAAAASAARRARGRWLCPRLRGPGP